MAAEGMQFPWRWNGGAISLYLGVIWEMPAKKGGWALHVGNIGLQKSGP